MPGLNIDSITAETDYGFANEADDGHRRMMVRNVASWTLVDRQIDSGKEFILGDDGRAIITADGSERAIDDIFLVAAEIELANLQTAQANALLDHATVTDAMI